MIEMYRQYICTAAFMVHNANVQVLLYVQVQYVCSMYSHQSMDQPGKVVDQRDKVAKPARGQLNRDN